MAQMTRVLVLTAAVCWLSAASVRADETLNEKIVKFCADKVGMKVGSGQCAGLPVEALKASGGKPFTDFKEFPDKGDYVWGELVYALEAKDGAAEEQKVLKGGVLPGDVMQLRDTKFSDGKYVRAANGHHTVVVKTVQENGKVLVVLEQNSNGKMFVTESTYRLNDLKAGWLRIYRPVPEGK
jgi:hypothetical protein